jgi:hypothetical protein
MPVITARVSDLKDVGPIIDLHVTPSRAALEAIKATDQKSPAPVSISALIDTGASVSALKTGVARDLGLHPVGVQYINTPTSQNVPCYTYFVRFVFGVLPLYFEGVVIETPLAGQSIDCLIGRDILAAGLLVYNGVDNSFSFSL